MFREGLFSLPWTCHLSRLLSPRRIKEDTAWGGPLLFDSLISRPGRDWFVLGHPASIRPLESPLHKLQPPQIPPLCPIATRSVLCRVLSIFCSFWQSLVFAALPSQSELYFERVAFEDLLACPIASVQQSIPNIV